MSKKTRNQQIVEEMINFIARENKLRQFMKAYKIANIDTIYLTFRASETRVFSNLIFYNLLNFIKILKTHFCLNFTILQLFLKFHYKLAHRSIKGM